MKIYEIYTFYKFYHIIKSMDWYIIQYLYPRAFKRFTEIMFPNVGLPCVSLLTYFDQKKLYRFFDKEGVYLNVEMYNKHQWVFTISLENGMVFGPTEESKISREDSENSGFIECFKVLEKKLAMVYE